MERTESKKPAFAHHPYAKWVSENPRGLDQLLKQVIEMFEEDGSSVANKVDAYSSAKPELIARLKELCNSSSKNHYDEKVAKQARLLQEPGSEQDDEQFTPARKSYSHEDNASPGSTDTSISFGADGFTKNGTDSSSLSSDPETDPFDHSIGNPLSINGLGMQNDFAAETPELETGFDIAMKMNQYGAYKELIDRARSYEEELMLARKKLQLSEEENSRWKSELKKSETSARDLQVQLEAANVQLQNHISESTWKNSMLKEELELSKEELNKSTEDKAEITLKYDAERSRVYELEKRLLGHESDISELHIVVSELRAEILESQEKYLSEKDQLLSGISGILERQKVLETTVTSGECKVRLLEENLSRCESEKVDLEEMLAAAEREKQQISDEFQTAILEKNWQVEELNKDSDKLKLKYDMLMAEKDELNAQIQNLSAQLSSRDDRIRRVEEEREGLVAASQSAQKVTDELRFRVAELEGEVGQQKTAILDGAEKKREAIRQLCFSLDHYKTEYQVLRQAFSGRTRKLVVA